MMVNNVLDAKKIESQGGFKIVKDITDVRRMVYKIISVLKTKAIQKGIELESEVDF